MEWGKAYLKTILKELPEEFDVYALEIEVNSQAQKEDDDKSSFSRNFTLKKLEEY